MQKFADDARLMQGLVATADLSADRRARISGRAADWVRDIRHETQPGFMEQVLAEYGLSTNEGVALMCLAEAMLRVPDAPTLDALIEDKIAPSDWGRHLGAAASPLVNASTWALMLTGRVLDPQQPGVAGLLRGVVRRLGEPVIRVAVQRAMAEMGRQFVLGQDINAALARAGTDWARGYTHSFDMLGEAAMTRADARRYADAYAQAIAAIAGHCAPGPARANPGISVKLSALHPRYEVAQQARVLQELVPVLRDLARQAARAGMGFSIDAEEQDRLQLSLQVIEAVLADPQLQGWDGFGVVVQAYGKRAPAVIDQLHRMAGQHDRHLMVRLVKGAYWDSEVKHAQVLGLPGFAVLTAKQATDVSYIALARQLFDRSDRLFPQFATHNAHSMAAVLDLAEGRRFEFQRLHGMGERLHQRVLDETGQPCRIYAPVGAHRDLLAYLVRRLLENGANSSFVHQIVDPGVRAETIARDPFADLEQARPPQGLNAPDRIHGPDRKAAQGVDLSDPAELARIDQLRQAATPDAGPMTVSAGQGTWHVVHNPATGQAVAQAQWADVAWVAQAVGDAQPWRAPVAERARILCAAADLFEQEQGPLFAALAREAGKTLPDAVGELREAVDFLRYYAAQARMQPDSSPLGRIVAISPWNFPLAIFTGQIAAALAMGNAVLAKPAEQTPLVAAMAVRLLHRAGVPRAALQLLPGAGGTVGAALTRDPRVDGVVFTGSTATAHRIRATMAAHLDPGAPLVAETGGLNAMIVDSTALPEQVVRDVLASAFQSAGQRCSALRCLYLQDDIAPQILTLLQGAMDELTLGDPWHLSTDIGPVIDLPAQTAILTYIEQARSQGRVLHQRAAGDQGHFVPPTLISVSGIADLQHEVFGPVLHVARFRADQIGQVIADINATGYGLTFGLHSRIDARVQQICDRITAGNLYVNRNQIGAVVGSQPFGGQGLSGTGPKAGGPLYLSRFTASPTVRTDTAWTRPADLQDVTQRLLRLTQRPAVSRAQMPGPTGEANVLTTLARGPILCLGPGRAAQARQMQQVTALGGNAVAAEGAIPATALTTLPALAGVIWWGDQARDHAAALAARPGPIVPLITGVPDLAHIAQERHLCIDTTAAGGNVSLLAGDG